MTMNPQLLFSRQQIDARITELTDEMRIEYTNKKPLLLGILKGSVIFLSDIIRKLDIPLEIDFVRLSSYGAGITSSGNVQLILDTTIPVAGRHVLIIEDIVDTGLTISFLFNYLKSKNPASLKLCALLDKTSRRKVPVHIDYLGFTVPDIFIVGYGIDYNEQFRHLPDICYIE